jgi:DNA repair exonuclease SbcCD ATPase subunit
MLHGPYDATRTYKLLKSLATLQAERDALKSALSNLQVDFRMAREREAALEAEVEQLRSTPLAAAIERVLLAVAPSPYFMRIGFGVFLAKTGEDTRDTYTPAEAAALLGEKPCPACGESEPGEHFPTKDELQFALESVRAPFAVASHETQSVSDNAACGAPVSDNTMDRITAMEARIDKLNDTAYSDELAINNLLKRIAALENKPSMPDYVKEWLNNDSWNSGGWSAMRAFARSYYGTKEPAK